MEAEVCPLQTRNGGQEAFLAQEPQRVLLGFRFSREMATLGCIYTEKKIYFKELIHVITEAGKSKINRVGQQVGGPGQSCRFQIASLHNWVSQFLKIDLSLYMYSIGFASLENPD